VATWQYEEWGHLNPGDSVARRIERLTQHTGRPGLPTTLIAVDGNTIMGTASLVRNDLTTHPHLSPFMASVYVAPEFRRRGIATALVRRAIAVATELGVPELYLITADQQHLYATLGWEPREQVNYRGESVTLMVVKCAA
jgi:N-acetylglutamate synthase-like GNAT family acetyltransferase